jgi:hypothetical protein
MMENKACNGTIWTVANIQNIHDDWVSTAAQKESWQRFGHSRISYITCNGIIEEDKAFATKQELLESL